MTGNVSNVFLTRQEWRTTLGGVRAALRPGGYLVFEVRGPGLRAVAEMEPRDYLCQARVCSRGGVFESWLEVTRVDGDLVSTRRTCPFSRLTRQR